jgi:hypothetical protein
MKSIIGTIYTGKTPNGWRRLRPTELHKRGDIGTNYVSGDKFYRVLNCNHDKELVGGIFPCFRRKCMSKTRKPLKSPIGRVSDGL